jgi:hypothetical protein
VRSVAVCPRPLRGAPADRGPLARGLALALVVQERKRQEELEAQRAKAEAALQDQVAKQAAAADMDALMARELAPGEGAGRAGGSGPPGLRAAGCRQVRVWIRNPRWGVWVGAAAVPGAPCGPAGRLWRDAAPPAPLLPPAADAAMEAMAGGDDETFDDM